MGWDPKNRQKRNAYSRKYYAANREVLNAYQRAYYLKHRIEFRRRARARWVLDRTRLLKRAKKQYARLMGVRPTKCECCARVVTHRRLHRDHNHTTGKFRGWLCSQCNVGLGMLGDTRRGLLRALRYLGRKP